MGDDTKSKTHQSNIHHHRSSVEVREKSSMNGQQHADESSSAKQ
jgi:hypothetical protein